MRIKVSICLLLIFGIAYSQDTLSLADAIAIGLENNYQVRIFKKQLEIDKNNNAWGTAGRYPNISFNTAATGVADRYVNPALLAEARNSLGDSALVVNTQQTLNVTPSVNLNWMLFNGFAINITKSKLAYLQEYSEGNTVIVIQNSLQSILLAYHYVLLDKEALAVLNEVKTLSADRYRYVLSRKEFGNAVTFDVLQAQNNYLADSANALRQEINYNNSRRNLNLVIAEPVNREFDVVGEVLEIDQDFVLSDLVSKLESNNATLQNQYINQEILRKNVDLSKSELYPSLSLSAGFGRTYTGLYGDLETYSWENNGYRANASLTLSYTLSNGGNVRRAIQNARIQQEIGDIRTEEMLQSLYNSLYNTLQQYNIKRQLLHVANVSVESSRLNMQIAEEKYRSGAINSFNYRDIQLSYLNAARDQLTAKFNVIDSYTELLRLTGGIVTEFDPE